MICPICGFHNEFQDEVCGSCGQPLSADVVSAGEGADVARAPDPSAVTRTVAAPSTPCWNCGLDNEPTRTFCHACGQQLRPAGRRWRPLRSRRRPSAVANSEDERRRRYAAIAGMAAVALVLVTMAAVVGGFLGDKRGAVPASSPAAAGSPVDLEEPGTQTPGGEGTPAASGATPGDGTASGAPIATSAGGARFRCESQSHVAPASGAWQIYGARYGNRGGFDYLQLNLRRRGGSDRTGSVSAELVPLAEVDSRFGVAPPNSGDVALVVLFEGPVRLSGTFGRRPNQRALREFRLVRTPAGTAAILGVTAPGCFELLAPGWSDGAGGGAAVVVNIQR